MNIDKYFEKLTASAWYQNWHQNEHVNIIHWSILLVFAISIGSAQVSTIYKLAVDQEASIITSTQQNPKAKPKVAPEEPPILTSETGPQFAQDRVLVKFKDKVTKNKKSEILSKHGLSEKSEIGGIGIKVLTIKDDETPEEVVDKLKAQHKDDIEFVELDSLLPPSVTPNDPSFPSQWEKTKTNTQIAWDTTTGDPNMIIGIADTGVNCNHADLSCVPGWNAASNTTDTSDYYGHGTAVAGTAAARTNNTLGVAGQVWNSKIMPIRVTNSADGYAYCSTIASGITWAADHGAKVVNNSYDVSSCSSVMSAGKYLRGKGGLLTISAGNTGTDRGIISSPDTIVVSGVQSSDVLYSWSSFGNHVDVAAPGCVTTTNKAGGYGGWCGTSFAAPMTAGTLALIFAANPALTPAQAENILFSTARDLGTVGWDTKFGWGAIDAAAAVTQAKNTTGLTDTLKPSVPTGLTANASVFNQVNLSWSPAVDNVAVTGYNVFRDGVKIGTVSTNSFQDKTTTEKKTYVYTVSAFDAANNTSAMSASTTVTTPDITLVITSQQVPTKTTISATVQTTTNLPATAVVSYGTSASALTTTVPGSGTASLTQTVQLTGLTGRTTYYYKVEVKNASGTLMATTPISSFKTSSGGGKR